MNLHINTSKGGIKMSKIQRENWGSRIGFIMAAAGSAVGLGNIWRFPYMAGSNGGGAFIMIYMFFSLVIGISIMIAEFAIGRRTSLGSVGAYKSINIRWTFAGVLGVLSSFFIMGFYPVVGGWSIAYIFKSATGLLSSSVAIKDIFDNFVSNPIEPLIWIIIFLGINAAIVAKGITAGIEKASKILMPMLFILLVLISIRSITLPGSEEGLSFLFEPDFTSLKQETYLAALGQSFFSLSLGMGCMITYGSYLNKNENLPTNALIITLIGAGVAILAGLAIFPALFAFGMEPEGGPGLVFVVVPLIFKAMGRLGVIFAIIFFISLTVAALTSSVSLLEVVVAYFIDQRGMDRKKAVYISFFSMFITSTLSSLSLGVMSETTFLGVGAFDFFDILTDKIFLSIGGLLLAIFCGWFVKKEDLKDELTNGGTIKFRLFELWYNLVKFVIPVAIAFVAVMGIISIEQTGLMLFGVTIVVLLAIFSRKL